MKYSVVIPVYNKAPYVVRTLTSVLSQNFDDYEIIVVDDGSTDGSMQKLSQVQSPKLRIIQQENQGVAVARNTGILAARGEYIAFLDADDAWLPEYLQTIDRLVETYPQSDIFVTAYEIAMARKKNTSTQLVPEEGCLESYWTTLTNKYDFVWTSATTIRKSALVRAGLFKPGEKIGQDLDMWARVARNNPRVAYSAKICVSYTRNATENARTRVKIAWAGAFLQDLEEELANQSHTPEELQAIQRKYDLKMTVYIYTSILAGAKSRAFQALKSWKGSRNVRNTLLRAGLYIAACMPQKLVQWVYQVRLNVF